MPGENEPSARTYSYDLFVSRTSRCPPSFKPAQNRPGFGIQPRKSLESLPGAELSPGSAREERELTQAELLQSVLRVAGLDPVTGAK